MPVNKNPGQSRASNYFQGLQKTYITHLYKLEEVLLFKFSVTALQIEEKLAAISYDPDVEEKLVKNLLSNEV